MTAGPILENVLKACEKLDVNIVYFHTLKPIDKEAILRFKDTEIVVIHDAFGLYEAICEVPHLKVSYHGIPDKFCCCYGTVHDIRRVIGLDEESIRTAVRTIIQK